MKQRLHFIILLASLALCGMAQTIGDAFYIYRNDGQFNAFFRDEVDSIAYSYYDADSVRYEEVVTQLVYTADSIYKIPLAAIDSVGFVQPETVYKEGSIPLEGELFDYLIAVQEYTLIFNIGLPSSLMPRIGDKIVATDITEKLPNGFVGVVRSLTTGNDGIHVECESIELSETVSRYYGVYDVISGNGHAYARGPLNTIHDHVIYNNDLPFGQKNIQIGLSGFVKEKDIFDINVKNTFDITYIPTIRLKITRVIDDLLLRSHTNLFVVADVDADVEYEISGEAQKEWKQSFLPKQDYLIAGIPVYIDIGAKASLGGEIATAFSFKSLAHVVTDITYYDVSLLPVIGSVASPMVNRVGGDVKISTMDLEWDYIGFRAEFKPRIYTRIGLSAISHVAGWVGGEFDFGLLATGELMFDVDRIRNAEPGTAVYDELKDIAKIDIKPYVGAHFVAAAFDDHYTFSVGKDFDTPLGTWFQGRILPGFSDTQAKRVDNGKARATVRITNDCPIPYTVGFAIYDENQKFVDAVYYEEKFWMRNAFKSYTCEFEGLDTDGKYTIYPVIRMLGKYNMLASPSAELEMSFPVELSDFKVTKSQYQKNGFSHNGRQYDYSFDVSVTATLDEEASDISEWGYAYLDENGNESLIPLSSFGRTYTDTRYAYYRDEASSVCTLYGYVKYKGSNEIVYGEPNDYPLEYKGDTLCPDGNHPHYIDLGLPSGTKWACCNVGASAPEEVGGYYAWGETETKPRYGDENYKYYINSVTSMYGDWSVPVYVYIGNDISGTNYDVAHVKWGNGWRMPTMDEMKELKNSCSSSWYNLNGKEGKLYTGPNGNKLFLPACGWYTGSYSSSNHYWSSTLDPYDTSCESSKYGWYPYVLDIDDHSDSFCSRGGGIPVRPIISGNIYNSRRISLIEDKKNVTKKVDHHPIIENNVVIKYITVR